MRKKVVLILILLLALTLPVSATQRKIVDNAWLLSESETALLQSQAEALVESFGQDVVIVTVMSTNGVDAQAYADDYFDNNGYGIGSNHSGVLLLLVMDSREWVISTCGESMELLTRAEADSLFDDIASYISSGDYYDGFSLYLELLPEYMSVPTAGERFMEIAGISLLIGLVAGGIVLLILRSGMRTAKQQHGAGSYVKNGSFQMLQHGDFYLYSHTSRVRRESSNSSGGHRSSSGRSHGGSRGRF